ncbi:hypothetical protein FGG08_003987 [Glutinoglossum americanum]|uniref:Uncharacterized protein n=1 Tax=Glutinoglossum americanum TaxID=1670608 RepID=A0A9P8I6I4_9PEZI|nr:hypothetical protein FGG08_003987 [Glutinoglossum americanum]
MPYDRYESQRHRGTRRGAFGHWIPLVVTVTAATLGLAAWIWSERRGDDDDDSYEERKDDHGDASEASNSDRRRGVEDDASGGMVARMSGALRRTPSPQQLFDGASKKVVAGVAAAGTMVGGVLSSIREEEKDDFVDHSRWSEEADVRRLAEGTASEQTSRQAASASVRSTSGLKGIDSTPVVPATSSITDTTSRKAAPSGYHQSTVRRKKAAIVVSAETNLDDQGEDEHGNHEQASILSHLSSHIDLAVTELFVLIYAPEIKQHPLSTSSSIHRPAISNTSSFSNIDHENAYTPGEELDKPLSPLEPRPVASVSSGLDTPRTPALSAHGSSPAFKTLYSQALSLVEDKNTMVLPFTTPSGHLHILRHLAPDVVYLQESLSGENGDVVTQISSWVGQVVVVVGAEGGHGGLVDSEDEHGSEEKKIERWWERADRVGLGKGVEVVEALHVGEHWGRRMAGRE